METVEFDGKKYQAVKDDFRTKKVGCKPCDLNNKFHCNEVNCMENKTHYKLVKDGNGDHQR